jgi:hypothetical protein
MLQVIEAILKNPDDKTQVRVASHIVIYVTLSNNFLLMCRLPMLHVCVCITIMVLNALGLGRSVNSDFCAVLSRGYTTIWVNLNTTHLINRVKLLNLDMTHYTKWVT